MPGALRQLPPVTPRVWIYITAPQNNKNALTLSGHRALVGRRGTDLAHIEKTRTRPSAHAHITGNAEHKQPRC